jgi:hypothetical protein
MGKMYRKYYLHQKIKHLFRYSSKRKTVFVPHDYDGCNKDLQELQNKYNYQIQYSIK